MARWMRGLPFFKGRQRSRGRRDFDRHLLFHELLESLPGDKCPICYLVALGTGRHLESLLHEGVTDPDVRASLRRAAGFCSRHAREALQQHNALGMALLYEDIVRHMRFRLERTRTGVRLAPLARCPQCTHEEEDTARYVRALATALRDPCIQAAHSEPTAHGLCLPHLEATLDVADAETADFLCAVECARLDCLAEELREFIRKNDYRFAGEPMTSECDAWIRAVRKIAGEGGNRRRP